MIPPDATIREWAYYQWERRGGGHGQDLKDWLDAEQHLRLLNNYQPLIHHFLSGKPKAFLGKGKDRCRYCGRGKKETTFRKEAHSVPEFLGNRSLISKDECDRCNDFFSTHIEDHFAKMIMPMRAALGISGKTGVPTFTPPKSKKVRLEHDNNRRHITILESETERIMTVDRHTKTISVAMTCQPHIPVAAFKCLTKIALAIMPDQELKHYDLARKWILDPDHSLNEEHLRGFGCYCYSTPNPYIAPWVMLLRRTDPFVRLPYMLLLIGTSNLLFQAMVPICYQDNHLQGSKEPLPRFASHLIPLFGVLPICETISMSSPHMKCDQEFTARMTYGEEIDLPDGEAGKPPFSDLLH
jgi:hypothetical protein